MLGIKMKITPVGLANIIKPMPIPSKKVNIHDIEPK
jgi:hypothetical protein